MQKVFFKKKENIQSKKNSSNIHLITERIWKANKYWKDFNYLFG